MAKDKDGVPLKHYKNINGVDYWTERIFGLVLYPDAENYDCAYVLKMVEQLNCQWCYILHDKDVKEDGSDIKPHYHVYMRFREGKTVHSLKKELEIKYIADEEGNEKDEPYTLFWFSSWQGCIKYGVHDTEKSKHKYQYSFNQYHSNFDVSNFFKSSDEESEKALDLLDYIENEKITSIRKIFRYACMNNQFSVLRRSTGLFIGVINEVRQAKQWEEHYKNYSKVGSSGGFSPADDVEF